MLRAVAFWLTSLSQGMGGGVRAPVQSEGQFVGRVVSSDGGHPHGCDPTSAGTNLRFHMFRRLFGDECLGAANLDMISIAQKHGAAAKFPGSGGAIVGLCPDPSKLPAVREALESAGYVVVMVKPYCS